MKKILCWLLLVLMLMAVCSPALAACTFHPYASTYTQYETRIEIFNQKYHIIRYLEMPYCNVCGSYAGTGGDIASEVWEEHSFRDGECSICYYQEEGMHHGEPLHTYSEEELQAEALLLGDEVIGAKGTVVREGNIRAEADEYSSRIGGAFLESEFIIKDYFVNSRYRVWFKIDYMGREAWISASLVKVTVSNAISGDSAETAWFIQRQCKIITSSGRARFAPDLNAPIIAYVHYGELYRIGDCQVGTDGKLWFKILFDGDPCWISSSLAEVY